jgi:hypothetical protein
MRIMQWRTLGALLSTTMLLSIVAHVRAQELAQNLRGFKDPNQGLHIAKQGMFFVGGQYYTSSIDGLKYMSGQMYVEYQIPEVVTALARRTTSGAPAPSPPDADPDRSQPNTQPHSGTSGRTCNEAVATSRPSAATTNVALTVSSQKSSRSVPAASQLSASNAPPKSAAKAPASSAWARRTTSGAARIGIAGTPKSVGRRIVTSTGTASASDFSLIENLGLFIVTCGPIRQQHDRRDRGSCGHGWRQPDLALMTRSSHRRKCQVARCQVASVQPRLFSR